MRQLGLIIGKWKMRRIIHLEIFWVDAGRAPGSGAFSAMSSGEDGVGGWKGTSRVNPAGLLVEVGSGMSSGLRNHAGLPEFPKVN
jgi:hypothetical protein